MSPRADRHRLIPLSLAVLAALALLTGLGTWQLQRKAWKEALIAAVDQRVEAPPQTLPPPNAWGRLTADADEFRRVRFRARFEAGTGTNVYAAGSALRDDVTGPGIFVFRPGRLDDGSTVVVERGFVPGGATSFQAAETLDLVGYLRWPERHSWFFPDHDAVADLWFVRDPQAMAAAKGWGLVAPFYVAQEAPLPPGGLPRPGPIKVRLPNNHLGYAITWFGLALALAGVYLAFFIGRRRGRHDYAAVQRRR